MSSKLTTVVALIACGALALAADVGARITYETTVTIHEQNGDFHGKVKSDQLSCQEDRKVTLWKKRNGDDQKIASDTAASNGDWSTGNTHVEQGKYYAKAGKDGDCESGKSPNVTVN